MELLIQLVECFNFSIFSVLSFSIVALVCKYLKTGNRLAPGPVGLPFIGNLLSIGQNFPQTMTKLSKRFGPVFKITLGSSSMIVLSSLETIKEAFRKPELSGRNKNELYELFQGYGITNQNGARWQAERKFLITQLRSLGMKIFGPKREKLEQNIMGEVMPFLATLKTSKGESFNPDRYLTLIAANILSKILMSKKFSINDADYTKMVKLNREGFELFAKAELWMNLPLMKYSSKYTTAFAHLKKNFEAEKTIISDYVSEMRKTFDPQAPVNDIVTGYFSTEYNARLEGQDVSEDETDRQVIQVILDLFSGGSETMRSCFNWIFLVLLHHPEVVTKIQAELDEVVGRDQLPTLEDMLSLNYTRAAISEILRFTTVAPVALHAAIKDTSIGSFFIPKGTLVVANHLSCHKNPKLFPNPDKFIPERFINESGRYDRAHGFIAFGFGQRACPAEVMAKCAMFLNVSCVLHAFNLGKPDTSKLPDLAPVYAFSNNPKLYEIRFLPREDLQVNIDEGLSNYGKLT